MFIKYIDKLWPLYPYKSKYLAELTRNKFQLLANIVEATGSFKAAEIFFPGYSARNLEYIYYFLICGYRGGAKPSHLLYPKLSQAELQKIDKLYCRGEKPPRWKDIAVLFPRIGLNNLKNQYYRWKKIKPPRRKNLKKILSDREREKIIELHKTYGSWKKLAEYYPDYRPSQIKYYYYTCVLGLDYKSIPKKDDQYWTPERTELFRRLWTSEKDLSFIRKMLPGKSPAKLYAQAGKMGIGRLAALK